MDELCENCKYSETAGDEQPCKVCDHNIDNGLKKWQPKEEPKMEQKEQISERTARDILRLIVGAYAEDDIDKLKLMGYIKRSAMEIYNEWKKTDVDKPVDYCAGWELADAAIEELEQRVKELEAGK